MKYLLYIVKAVVSLALVFSASNGYGEVPAAGGPRVPQGERRVDPETGQIYYEREETVTVRVAEPDPPPPQIVEVPAKAPQGKARLAVLPAVFTRHFQPRIRLRGQLEVTGDHNWTAIFTTAHERRMEAPSFTLSLTEAFVGSRKFDVLERARLSETLREIDFGASDYANPDQVVPMGQALNAEYVVLPEIQAIEAIEEFREIPYVDRLQHLLRGKMIVRIRVVDTAQTRVVEAATETVTVERRPRPGEPFPDTEIDTLIMDLYRTAGLRLLHRTLEAIYPVRLIEVDNNRVVLNRGEGAIDAGDVFDVFALGRALMDPDTGEMLGRRETKVARIRVETVRPRFSEAVILEGADALGGELRHFLCRETAESITRKQDVSRLRIHW